VKQQKKQGGKVKGPSPYRDSDERRGHRFLFVCIPIIVLVVFIFYVLALDPSRPVGQPIPGTSIASEQAPSGESSKNAYRVVLDDGRTITIDGSLMGPLKANRRVLVQENRTILFKRNFFSFARYLE